MPLIENILPSRERVEELDSAPQLEPHNTQKDLVCQDSGYEDFQSIDEDSCEGSDMEGSILHRPRPKKVRSTTLMVPALPQRSERRTSKILENVIHELKSLEGTKSNIEAAKVQMPAVEESDPHELYLSSEEDGSLSDEYDYEDYLSDLEMSTSQSMEDSRAQSSRPSSRKSREITATAVSFQSVGRPQLVEIVITNNSPQSAVSRNPLSMNLDTVSFTNSHLFASGIEPPKRSLLRRPTPLNLREEARRMSVSSTTSSQLSLGPLSRSTSTYTPSASSYIPSSSSFIPPTSATIDTAATSPSASPPHPPRKSSRLASLTTLVTQTKNNFQIVTGSTSATSHSFLTSDPFASPEKQSNGDEEREKEPTTPKTPTAWKMSLGRGFQRTLSKARKTSMPKISLAYTAGVVTPRNTSMLNVSTPDTEVEAASMFDTEEKTLVRPEDEDEKKDGIEEMRPATAAPTLTKQTVWVPTSDGKPKPVEKILRRAEEQDERKDKVEEMRPATAAPASATVWVPTKDGKAKRVKYEDVTTNGVQATPPTSHSLSTPTKERKAGIGMGMGIGMSAFGLGRNRSVKGR